MFNKKSRLGKRGGITKIAAFSLVFSLISIIYIFISVFLYATANDYLFYNLQNLTEELEQDGIVKEGTAALTQTFGEDFKDFELHLDDLWLIAYILFIASSFMISYKADRHNYFSFLGLLFYGFMFILFLLTIVSTITIWFKDNVLLAILPTVHIIVPKFYYYLDHLGVFSAIHLGICLLINMIDFDLAKIHQKKKIEEQAMEDNEVV